VTSEWDGETDPDPTNTPDRFSDLKLWSEEVIERGISIDHAATYRYRFGSPDVDG
jgi:hypothetical protein